MRKKHFTLRKCLCLLFFLGVFLRLVTPSLASGEPETDPADKQKAFFRTILETENPRERRDALEHLTDRDLLIRVFFESEDARTSRGAFNRLYRGGKLEDVEDEEFIARLAVNSPTRSFRQEVMKKMNDPHLLMKVTREEPSDRARQYGLMRLYEKYAHGKISKADLDPPQQKILQEAIEAKKYWSEAALKGDYASRRRAVQLLNDQEILAQMVEKERRDLRREALSKFHHQETLTGIALHDPEARYRAAALRNLRDQEVLKEVAQKDVAAVVRSAALRNIKNQEFLRSRALGDPHRGPRATATRALTNADQELLFRIAFRDSDSGVRKIAVAKLVSDEDLLKIALDDPSMRVRRKAWKRIEDPQVKENIHLDSTDWQVRRLLVDTRQLKEEQMRKVALTDENEKVALRAVAAMKKEEILGEIALQAPIKAVRRAAARKIEDQEILLHIALHDPEFSVRRTAVSGLNSEEGLQKVVRQEENRNILRTAWNGISDEAFIGEKALTSENPVNRSYAVQLLEDQELLAKVVVREEERNTRKVAAEKIENEKVHQKIVLNDDSELVRRVSIRQVQDQEVLARVALKDDDVLVRRNAVEKLTDQSILEKIALADRAPWVRFRATQKIKNPQVLRRVLAEDDQWVTRRAAFARLDNEEDRLWAVEQSPYLLNLPQHKSSSGKEALSMKPPGEPTMHLISEENLRVKRRQGERISFSKTDPKNYPDWKESLEARVFVCHDLSSVLFVVELDGWKDGINAYEGDDLIKGDLVSFSFLLGENLERLDYALVLSEKGPALHQWKPAGDPSGEVVYSIEPEEKNGRIAYRLQIPFETLDLTPGESNLLPFSVAIVHERGEWDPDFLLSPEGLYYVGSPNIICQSVPTSRPFDPWRETFPRNYLGLILSE